MGTLLRLKFISAFSGNVARFSSTIVPPTTCVHKCKLLVVGGGTGGCSVAWRFAKRMNAKDIVILEPSEYHYYQPLFTLIAAGIKQPLQARRSLLSVIPNGVCWYRGAATCFDPDKNLVYTECGNQISYDYMVVALGLVNRYDEIPGLKDLLQSTKSKVTTIYSPQYCAKTWSVIQDHRGGHAIFTFPKRDAKCSGAAQKIMYLADDYWRKKKLRDCTSISYHTGGKALFGVPKYATALNKVANERNIARNYCSELVAVNQNSAVFQIADQKITLPFNLLHVTPTMTPPECLRHSTLVTTTGYLSVDHHTLQHTHYANIYGIGDCTSTPNSKTAAAIGPQSYVVEQNLTDTMMGRPLSAKYDGYGSCPMLTSYKRGILAEFTYDKKVCETFPFDQSKERRLFYHLKTHYFPYLYWNKLIRGKWNGPKRLRKVINPTGR